MMGLVLMAQCEDKSGLDLLRKRHFPGGSSVEPDRCEVRRDGKAFVKIPPIEPKLRQIVVTERTRFFAVNLFVTVSCSFPCRFR
jgi:hypothetical protein